MPYAEAPLPLRRGEKYVLTLENYERKESPRDTRVSTRSTNAFTVALAKGFTTQTPPRQSANREPTNELKQIGSDTAHFNPRRVVKWAVNQLRSGTSPNSLALQKIHAILD